MPPAARFLCKQRLAIASHRQACGCGFFDAVYGTGFGAEWSPGASNHRHYRHCRRRLLLVARVRVEEKQLLGLSSEGIGCVKWRLYFSPLPLLLFMPWFPSRKLC